MSQPIDYARADADVVRKKFRRRVVMFVIATVVVMVIGASRTATQYSPRWLIGSSKVSGRVSLYSFSGQIVLVGPMRLTSPNTNGISGPPKRFQNRAIGVEIYWYSAPGLYKWTFAIRYRTLFLLAMIPWIITLIRLIRVWKRKRVLEPEPRTQ